MLHLVKKKGQNQEKLCMSLARMKNLLPQRYRARSRLGNRSSPLMMIRPRNPTPKLISQTFEEIHAAPGAPAITHLARTFLIRAVDHSQQVHLHFLHRLNEDIDLFVNWMKPRPEEKYSRDIFINLVTSLVKSVCGETSQAIVFGSFATGLYLPTSDIDMVILNSERDKPIHKLAKELRKQKSCTKIVVIAHARVPLIRLENAYTGMQMDISFDMDNGPRNTIVVNRLLEQYPVVSKERFFIFPVLLALTKGRFPGTIDDDSA